jgi:DNA-binding CsgD family transcriptional regulator
VTLIGGGFTNDEIADQLCISGPTILVHVTHVLQKLGFAAGYRP